MDDEKLDDSWIVEFATSDKLYNDFYKNDIYYVDVHYVYINSDDNIVKINRETFLLTNVNYMSRDEVVGLIKRNSFVDSVRYSIMSILKYNITLEPEHIKQFLYDCPTENYMTPIKHIDTIKFERSINMFQDLNDLLFIFYEKSDRNTNSTTKKIFIHKNAKHKKTDGTRKQYS
jgi:hypothetical protein